MSDAQEYDDSVPISVRLGTVVPPEDPEDWTRPLTWVAALGMVAAPMAALAWFVIAPPVDATAPLPGTWLIAAALVAGAAVTGATQLTAGFALAATLGTGLFSGLLVIIIGLVTAGERQVGAASPTLAHAFLAAVAGLAGTLVTASLAPLLLRLGSRLRRALIPGTIGVAVSALVVPLLSRS